MLLSAFPNTRRSWPRSRQFLNRSTCRSGALRILLKIQLRLNAARSEFRCRSLPEKDWPYEAHLNPTSGPSVPRKRSHSLAGGTERVRIPFAPQESTSSVRSSPTAPAPMTGPLRSSLHDRRHRTGEQRVPDHYGRHGPRAVHRVKENTWGAGRPFGIVGR